MHTSKLITIIGASWAEQRLAHQHIKDSIYFKSSNKQQGFNLHGYHQRDDTKSCTEFFKSFKGFKGYAISYKWPTLPSSFLQGSKGFFIRQEASWASSTTTRASRPSLGSSASSAKWWPQWHQDHVGINDNFINTTKCILIMSARYEE